MSKLRQAAEQEPVECMCGICKLGKREWVGLTDEEMDELVNRFARYGLAREIESKLKDKNGG